MQSVFLFLLFSHDFATNQDLGRVKPVSHNTPLVRNLFPLVESMESLTRLRFLQLYFRFRIIKLEVL